MKSRLAQLRRQALGCRPGSRFRYLDYTITVNDGPNFYMLYKDIVVRRIYHFEAQCLDPLILDCGSNIGLSILYFKHVYPRARIVGFEPDPTIYAYLERNIQGSQLNDVQLVQSAVADRTGMLTLYSDGKYGSCLEKYGAKAVSPDMPKYQVRCVSLRDYLNEPVAFLKMNIEGAEWDVLADCGQRLRQVNEMVIEYHHLPGLQPRLHRILELLHRHGFEYLVSGFDCESSPATCPPFCLARDSRYFLLIYARQSERGLVSMTEPVRSESNWQNDGVLRNRGSGRRGMGGERGGLRGRCPLRERWPAAR